MELARIPLPSFIGLSLLALGCNGCCPPTPAPAPAASPAPNADTNPPTPGPVIVLKPTSPSNGSYTASWTVGGHPCDPSATNEAGKLRLDAYGKVLTFKIFKNDASHTQVPISSVSLTITDSNQLNHPLNFKKGVNGYTMWKVDTSALPICDMQTSDCLDDCQSTCGLPQDFFGTFTDTQIGGVNVSDIDYIEFQADWTNPCPSGP
jgi:hypothetical protein